MTYGFTTHEKGCNKNKLGIVKFKCTEQVSLLYYVTERLMFWGYPETYFVTEIVSS